MENMNPFDAFVEAEARVACIETLLAKGLGVDAALEMAAEISLDYTPNPDIF